MQDLFAAAPALHRTTELGALRCTVWQQAPGPATGLVVLCHGYGASGTDLVALAALVAAPMGTAGAHVRFVFPQAPLDLGAQGAPHSRAWWPLDVEALLRERSAGTAGLALLRERSFAGLPQARRALQSAVDVAMRQSGLSPQNVVLGGFSQGAMLATDLSLRLEEPPAGLAILSGTLIDQAQWQRLARRRAGLRVVQSHGVDDPVLPFGEAQRLCDLLRDAGCQVQFDSFAGGHTIDPQALVSLRQLLIDRFAATSISLHEAQPLA